MVLVNNAEYFIAIAQERSVSKAASKLYISQSSLSQYLSKLERELDAKLFDRSKTPLEITDAGRTYYNFLEQYIYIHQQLKADLDVLNSKRQQTLRLGISTLRGAALLPDILPEFMQKYPKTHLELMELPVSELYRAIDNNDVDFAVMNTTPSIPANFVTETILWDRILLATCHKHPATRMLMEMDSHGALSLKPICAERFILLAPELTQAKLVNGYLTRNEIVLTNVIVTTNVYTALNMVAENLGFCFVVESAARRLWKMEELRLFDMKTPELTFPISVVYKKDAKLSLAGKEFIGIVHKHYKSRI